MPAGAESGARGDGHGGGTTRRKARRGYSLSQTARSQGERRNVEIKARVHDLRTLGERIRALCGKRVRRLVQEDTFFETARGRLKLRVTRGAPQGELIAYHRPDRRGPRQCRYEIVPVPDPSALCRALARTVGIRGTVRKVRDLYMHGTTRVHLDRVEGLGTFMELEVVLAPGQTPAEGRRIARAIMRRVGISRQDCVDRAYIDMLTSGRGRS